MTIVTKKRSILAIYIIPDINFSLSAICLFLTYTVCCYDIRSGRTFFSFSEKTCDVIFRSIFNKEKSLQF